MTRTTVLTCFLLVAVAGWAIPEPQWLFVAKTSSGGELAIARYSVITVSKDVVSAWARHRNASGVRHLERYEVNCARQQRRILETWHRPDNPDSAPMALLGSG